MAYPVQEDMMLDKPAETSDAVVTAWLASLNQALDRKSPALLSELFQDDCHWRNVCGIAWEIVTFSGRDAIASDVHARLLASGAGSFETDRKLLSPRLTTVAGEQVIEGIFRFSTRMGPGIGVVRLAPSPVGKPKAWTVMTSLDIDAFVEQMKNSTVESHARDFAAPTWLEAREHERSFATREPAVLIVGGGHAGLSAAAELKRLGIDALIVDRISRIGDNWRQRYNGLKLHNKTPVNHLRYMNFPRTWPDYASKDQIANWLESYAESLELNFWTATSFESAVYDADRERWSATVRRADGATRVLLPKHIILATSVSSTPNVPDIPTLERFSGPVIHSSKFEAGSKWTGKSAIVFGTGTSAHDISQELHAHGAEVTMVQRSPTLVVNVDPSAQLYDQLYLGEGPDVDVRDIINMSGALAVTKQAHRLITRRVKELDKDLLAKLEAVGFRLEFGEDDTGWPLKFRTRGGGYYFNVGCSDLIAERKIRLVQAVDIKSFIPAGLELGDGSTIRADLVVLATGYKGPDHIISKFFGPDVAKTVGPVWGFDTRTQEMRNMWVRTRQPGLWFTGGSFSQSRIYSRYMALQIRSIERGELEKLLDD